MNYRAFHLSDKSTNRWLRWSSSAAFINNFSATIMLASPHITYIKPKSHLNAKRRIIRRRRRKYLNTLLELTVIEVVWARGGFIKDKSRCGMNINGEFVGVPIPEEHVPQKIERNVPAHEIEERDLWISGDDNGGIIERTTRVGIKGRRPWWHLCESDDAY